MTTAVPPLAEGACQVWWGPRAAADERLAAVLDDGERARGERYLRAEDRERHLVSHALARLVLGAHLGRDPAGLEFYAVCARCGGPHGKPRPREGDLEFSISHAGGLTAVAVARVAVGVDVEALIAEREAEALARTVLADGEALGDDPSAGLTAYWTRKEAVLKTTGDGLSVAPRELTVTPPGEPPALLRGPRVHLYGLRPAPGHLACLGAAGPVTVTEHDGAPLLRAHARAVQRS